MYIQLPQFQAPGIVHPGSLLDLVGKCVHDTILYFADPCLQSYCCEE